MILLRPKWDEKNRELSVNGLIVKRYKHTAANQTEVLAAFQKHEWSMRIPNPLHRTDTHQTLKELNKLAPDKIRFRGDGTGKGLTWDPVDLDSRKEASG